MEYDGDFHLVFTFKLRSHAIIQLTDYLRCFPGDRPIEGDIVKLVNLVYWSIIVKSHDQNTSVSRINQEIVLEYLHSLGIFP